MTLFLIAVTVAVLVVWWDDRRPPGTASRWRRRAGVLGLNPDCACDRYSTRPDWTHRADRCSPPPCQCMGLTSDRSGVVHTTLLCQPVRETTGVRP